MPVQDGVEQGTGGHCTVSTVQTLDRVGRAHAGPLPLLGGYACTQILSGERCRMPLIPLVRCVVPLVPYVAPLVPCVLPLVLCVVPLVPCVLPLVLCVVPLVPCVVDGGPFSGGSAAPSRTVVVSREIEPCIGHPRPSLPQVHRVGPQPTCHLPCVLVHHRSQA